MNNDLPTVVANTAQWLSGITAGTALAMVGWAVTAIGWYVSQRAQKRMFVFQALNAARAELVPALRTRQGALGSMALLTLSIELDHRDGLTANWPEKQWHDLFPKYRAISSAMDSQWLFLLEQYEVLFPETSECRKQLVMHLKRASEKFPTFFVELLNPQTRQAALAQCASLRDDLTDQQALIEDLLVHFQNVTLGKMVGRQVPFRQPADANVPRMVMGKDKVLRITNGRGENV